MPHGSTYHVYYDRRFFARCLKDWREACRQREAESSMDLSFVCDGNLDRDYLKARLLVDRESVRTLLTTASA